MRIGAVIAVLLSAAAVRAQPEPPEAQQARLLFEEGMAAIDREDYAAAIDAFTRSWEVSPKAIVLFNVAMCHRAMADFPATYDAFRRYLAAALEEPQERRAQAEEMLRELDAVLARVTVTADVPGARILLDGTEVGTSPLGEPLRVTTGTHVVRAVADGFESAEWIVEVTAGEATDVAFTLVPAASGSGTGGASPLGPPLDLPAEEEEGLASQWWFWTILGALVVGGGVTAGVLLWPEDEPVDLTVRFQ
ncbi:MAG: PEGA domain-containing protein [Deltaproteobacteria bacterium]|nr:PEGA domain-containing protein [Deltaproteobacteria bacterium]